MAHWGDAAWFECDGTRVELLPKIDTGHVWQNARAPLNGMIVDIVLIGFHGDLAVAEAFVAEFTTLLIGRPYCDWYAPQLASRDR